MKDGEKKVVEKKEVKKEVKVTVTPLMTDLELAERRDLHTLLRASKNLKNVKVTLPYIGVTFTVARADLTLPGKKNGNGKRELVGEGISRKSYMDRKRNDPNCGSNLARERCLESLDKQLRRTSHAVGHRFEG